MNRPQFFHPGTIFCLARLIDNEKTIVTLSQKPKSERSDEENKRLMSARRQAGIARKFYEKAKCVYERLVDDKAKSDEDGGYEALA